MSDPSNSEGVKKSVSARHCEDATRSVADEAISTASKERDCFASLAMTFFSIGTIAQIILFFHTFSRTKLIETFTF